MDQVTIHLLAVQEAENMLLVKLVEFRVVVEVVEEVDMVRVLESNLSVVEEEEKVIGFVVVVPGACSS